MSFSLIKMYIYVINVLHTKVKQNRCKLILFSIHRLLDILLCCCFFFVLTCKPCPHLFLGSRWRSPKPFREAFGMLLQASSLLCLFVVLKCWYLKFNLYKAHKAWVEQFFPPALHFYMIPNWSYLTFVLLICIFLVALTPCYWQK